MSGITDTFPIPFGAAWVMHCAGLADQGKSSGEKPKREGQNLGDVKQLMAEQARRAEVHALGNFQYGQRSVEF